jgi:hypothetical protein
MLQEFVVRHAAILSFAGSQVCRGSQNCVNFRRKCPRGLSFECHDVSSALGIAAHINNIIRFKSSRLGFCVRDSSAGLNTSFNSPSLGSHGRWGTIPCTNDEKSGPPDGFRHSYRGVPESFSRLPAEQNSNNWKNEIFPGVDNLCILCSV